MPSFTPLENRLYDAWRRYHVRAQVQRFVIGVVLSVLWSIQSGTSWQHITPLIGGAVWATWREMAPTMPWATVQQTVRDHKPASAPPGTPEL